LIDEFLTSAATENESDMIYDLQELKRVIKEKNTFLYSEGLFARVQASMISTTSELLFRHCADFLYHIVDFYSIEFMSEWIGPVFFQTLVRFIRTSPQKLIRFASKILAYFASVTSHFRDSIISILPFPEMLTYVHSDECPDEWTSSIHRIIYRCCSFPLPDQVSLPTAQSLASLLSPQLCIHSLSFAFRALCELAQNPEVCSHIASTDMLSSVPLIVEHFIASTAAPSDPSRNSISFCGKRIDERKCRIIIDAISIAHTVHAAHAFLIIPPSLLTTITNHKSPSVAECAITLIMSLILTDPVAYLPHFLRLELLSHLCNNVKWRSVGAKLRSADLLCLLSNWANDEFVLFVVDRMVLQPLLELFEVADNDLITNMIECIGSIVARGVAVGYGRLITGQLTEGGGLPQLQAVADSEDPKIAEFAGELITIIAPESEKDVLPTIDSFGMIL
jgi:hypothetical protein